jgi:hypothetical protein
MVMREIFYLGVLLKFVEAFIVWLKSLKIMDNLFEDLLADLRVSKKNSLLIH